MFTPFSSSRPTSNIGISVDVDTGLEVKPDAPTLPPFIAGEAAAAAEGTLAVAPPPQVDREGVAVTKEGAAAVTTTNTTATTTQQAQMPPLPSKFIPTGRYPAGTFGLPELVIPPKWLIRFVRFRCERFHLAKNVRSHRMSPSSLSIRRSSRGTTIASVTVVFLRITNKTNNWVCGFVLKSNNTNCSKKERPITSPMHVLNF